MCQRGKTSNVATPRGIVGVDDCIARLVSVLNANGFETVASCCGHGIRPGNIALADGRELFIIPDYNAARRFDRLFPPLARTTPAPDRPKRYKDWVERRVVSVRPIATGTYQLAVGSLGKVYGTYRGRFHIEFDRCDVCGVKVYVRHVEPSSIDIWE